MLVPAIPQYRRRRWRAKRAKHAPSPPAPLTLVAAVFEVDADALLTLTFDRAIDVSTIAPGDISVSDGAGTESVYVGVGVENTPTPQSVVLVMAPVGAVPPGPSTMSATASNGIVAAAPPVGEPWAGVANVELPFP